MKFYVVIYLTVVILTVACEDRSNKQTVMVETDETRHSNENPWVNKIINTFLPLDTNSILKEDNFMLSNSSRWDTSFVLFLRREPDKVSAVYYEVVPQNDLSFLSKKRLFFTDGICFELDTAIWNSIVEPSKELFDSPKIFLDCADCETFVVAHNYRTGFSSPKNIDRFRTYSNLVIKEVILPLKQLRDSIR